MLAIRVTQYTLFSCLLCFLIDSNSHSTNEVSGVEQKVVCYM